MLVGRELEGGGSVEMVEIDETEGVDEVDEVDESDSEDESDDVSDDSSYRLSMRMRLRRLRYWVRTLWTASRCWLMRAMRDSEEGLTSRSVVGW